MKHGVLVAPALAGLLGAAAHAQQADSASAGDQSTASPSQGVTLEELIVTAQKREQALQDVPAAITALSASALQEQGVTDIIGLSGLAPNVEVTKVIETPSIFIRGVGSQVLASGADGSVATHVDGVYVSRPKAQVAGFYDVDRIEILRGPQGDLYGRNSTGGAVNIVTRRPTESFEAWGRVSAGNYSRLETEGAISGPVVGDALLGRLSMVSLNHSGYTDNIATGNDVDDQSEWGVRGQLLWRATDNLELHLSADHYSGRDHSGGWHVLGPATSVPLAGVALGGTPATDPIREISSEIDPRRTLELTNLSLTATLDVSDTIAVRSISGYRKSRSDAYTDIDGSELPLGPLSRQEHGEQYSEELQLSYDTDRVHAIVGVYYFEETLFGLSSTPVNLPFLPPGRFFRPVADFEMQAAAAFGRVEFGLTDRLDLAVGGRYSWEERSVEGSVTLPNAVTVPNVGSRSWNDFSPRVTLTYELAPDISSYATWSKGFKSGAFVNGPNPPVDPEKVRNYELGLKSELFGGNAQVNLAVFRYDFADLQVNRVSGAVVITENAAEATIDGVELELRARFDGGFSIDSSISWLDARYEQYVTADPARLALGPLDLSGNQMPTAPEWSAYLRAEQAFILGNGSELSMAANYRWRDDQFHDPFNQPNAFQEAYGELGARLQWVSPSGTTTLALWGQNLTDEDAILATAVSSELYGFPRLASVNEPRTYGVEVMFKY